MNGLSLSSCPQANATPTLASLSSSSSSAAATTASAPATTDYSNDPMQGIQSQSDTLSLSVTSSCGDRMNVDTSISHLNNTGVSLFEQGRRTEAANTFLRALWQLEHHNNCGSTCSPSPSSIPSSIPTIISSSHLLASNDQLTDSTTVSSSQQQQHPNESGSQERAPPSSYIFQREDYDEGLHVYQKALAMAAPTPAMPSLSLCQQVVILRYNMGLIYIGYKQYNQARRWFQAAWNLLNEEQQQPVPGKDDNRNLQLYLLHNLGYCSYCLGQNQEAMRFYQDALAVMNDPQSQQQLQHDKQQSSLDRAATYNCIAVLLFHRSSAQENGTEEALALLQESLTTYQSLLATECNPHLATVLGNMGRIHFLTSDHERAMKAFHKAYHIRKQVLGDDSMDTCAMLFNLGQSLHYRGALDPAMDAYREFLRVAQSHYTSGSHRDICAVQRAMAQVHRQKGQLSEACVLLRKAFEAGCGAIGPLATEVSCILSEMGSLYAERNDYTNAIECFLQFLQTQESLYNDTNPLHANILITKINIARVYKHNSDYASALRYYKEVHAMQVQILASNNSNNNNSNDTANNATATPAVSNLEVASTLSSMGLMLYLLQAYKPALDCYQEALRVRLDKLGTSQHADVAETINSIGLVLFKLGMMEMAKEAFQECIQLRTKLMLLPQDDGTTTPSSAACTATAKAASPVSISSTVCSSSSSKKEIAVLMFNMATACMQNGEEDQGIGWYCESLRVERRVLGNDHPDVSMTLQHIARVHEERGDFHSAIAYFMEALEIAKKRESTNDAKTASTNKNHDKHQDTVVQLLRVIGNLHFMLGQVPESMACFAEASRLSEQRPQNNATASWRHRGLEGVSRTGANFYGLSRLHPPGAPVA